MNELFLLVNQRFNGKTISTVKARGVHIFLEVRRDFSTWMKDRISEYEFVELQDFVTFSTNLEKTHNSSGGRPKLEYYRSCLGVGQVRACVHVTAKGLTKFAQLSVQEVA